MAKFLSTATIDSKMLDGVRFTIRKPSYQTRGLIDLETNEPRQQIAKLSREATKLMAERDLIKLPLPSESNPSPTLQDDPNWVELNGQVGEIITQCLSISQAKVGPVWFKRCFVKVEGLELDGKESPSLEEVLNGPFADFVDEIVNACRDDSYLKSEEAKNLPSPSISDAAEEVTTKTSTVIPASTQAATEPEFAVATI